MNWEKFKSYFNGAELGNSEVLPCIFEAVKATFQIKRNIYNLRDGWDFAELITERHQDVEHLANLLIKENASWVVVNGKEELNVIHDNESFENELKEYYEPLRSKILVMPSDYADFMDVDAYLEEDKNEETLVWQRMKKLEETFAAENGIEYKPAYSGKIELSNGFTIIKGGFYSGKEQYSLCALVKDNALYIPIDFENDIIAHAIADKSDLYSTFFRRTTDDDCETIVVFDINGNERNLGTLTDAHCTMQRMSINEGARKLVYIDSNPTNLVYAFIGELGKFYHAEYDAPNDMIAANVYELESLRYY